MTDEEVREEMPVFWAAKEVATLIGDAPWDSLPSASPKLQPLTDEQAPVAIGTEWTPCVKLPIVVHVREQREGESHVSTREGITPVKHDDLIMRGVEGEEYPIGRALFDKTYTFTVYKHQERKPLYYINEERPLHGAKEGENT